MICSICAIIKNEQLFLKEWIDWHLSIGFDYIFLCEDVGSLPHNEITDLYDNVKLFKYNEEISKYENPYIGSTHQYSYYMYFLNNYKDNINNISWVAFIDIDEFIHIDNNLSIKELLSEYNEFNALYIYWKFFGADNHIKRPIGLVQENYTDQVEENDFDNGWRYKSIINFQIPFTFRQKLNVHDLVNNGVNSFKIPTHRIKTYHKIWINHYFTKSWEDWCERFISKGDVAPGHRKLEDFFYLNKNMLSIKDQLMNFYEEKITINRQ